MRKVALFLTLLLTILAAPATAAGRDWTKVVSATPAGGYLIGNPRAPVKVVEYFSLTCSHCKHFFDTGFPALRSNYVAPGKVILELRNFVLNPYDLAASVLMRCGSPASAARLYDAIFADQDAVFAGARAIDKDTADRITAAPEEKRTAMLARAAKIDRWFISKGMPATRVDACLTDPKGEKRLVSLVEAAVKVNGVEGTPTFLVNGAKQDSVLWEDLEPAIKNAIKPKAGAL